MNINEIKRRARLLAKRTQRQMALPYFQDAIAWLVFLGILRHNTIAPRRSHVTLLDMLKAGELEPRILEVLPALMIKLPSALNFEPEDVPEDLKHILRAMRQRHATEPFRGVAADQYMRWLRAPVFAIAARRIQFRKLPRRRESGQTSFAEIISAARLERFMTQTELAKKYGLSLRVIRDLEQGKLTASLTHVIDVLRALDRDLKVGTRDL